MSVDPLCRVIDFVFAVVREDLEVPVVAGESRLTRLFQISEVSGVIDLGRPFSSGAVIMQGAGAILACIGFFVSVALFSSAEVPDVGF